jgi:hypothetical protein
MSEQDRNYVDGIRKELAAALNEMQFWLRIMYEHSALIRNGLDPTEERLFREADQFFLALQPLWVEAESIILPDPGVMIEELIEKSLYIVSQLRDFKRNLTAMIKECRILTILPADLIDHIRREADFFLGELHFVRGELTPTKETIGIPDSGQRALTVPRLLIPDMPQRIDEIALEESLFWLRQNMEHASVLSLYFRPVVQDALYKTTKGHEGRLSDVYNTALNVNNSKTGLPKLLRNARQVVGDWDAFLRQLFDNVVHCRVPTGETNLWPILDDHLAREAEYYLTVLDIIGNVPGPQGGHQHSH